MRQSNTGGNAKVGNNSLKDINAVEDGIIKHASNVADNYFVNI